MLYICESILYDKGCCCGKSKIKIAFLNKSMFLVTSKGRLSNLLLFCHDLGLIVTSAFMHLTVYNVKVTSRSKIYFH